MRRLEEQADSRPSAASVEAAVPMLPFAHAGHWLVQLIYLVPLLVLVAVILAGRIRDKRERSASGDEPR